jgi:OOP family OmpA-OmpF porin
MKKGGILMKFKWWFYSVLILVAGLLVSSCAKQYVRAPFGPVDLSKKLTQGYKQKVDNFLIILDTSGTMSMRLTKAKGDNRTKLDMAKDIASNLNATLPALKLNSGLRIFGTEMKLIYGMTPHTEAGLEAAINSIKRADGLSPIGIAINAAAVDLESVTGRTAVILISDGIEDPPTNPLQAVENMKSLYGDNVCIYTVLVGNDPTGEAVMNQIAAAGGCGYAVNAQNIVSAVDMAEFVTNVFLAKEMDDDGDGVVNSLDRCPNTPRGAKVDVNGCPIDSDGDGVYDYLDKCPNTPRGLAVDNRGCPLPIKERVSIELQVQFDFDKAVVKPEFHDHLRGVANFLKTYPNTRVTLDGHTCWIGTEDYNQDLSERRAGNVKAYLVDKFGIAESRLTTRGYGESQPIASNDTREGRMQNRRVMAEISTVTTK